MLKIKTLLALCCLWVASQTAFAQSTDEEALKTTLNNYLDGGTQGDTARLNKAFHPNAIQRYVGNDGRLKDMAIRVFISKVPAGGVKRTTRIVSYNYVGNSATATTESVHESFKFIDFLNLLKFGDEWKIVSRVYSRVELTEELKGTKQGGSAPTAKAAPKKQNNPAAVKPKADDGW